MMHTKMLDFSDAQGKVALAVIILVVLAAGYFVWTRSAPPVPRPAPGQTLQNPLGLGAPGSGGTPAAPPGPIGPSPGAPYAGRR
jgi:hypothetical protein